MRVLIVDDSEILRGSLRRAMTQAGLGEHEYLEAENGRIALELIERDSVDLVLCDWNMPEMSGIELLEAVSAAERSIPFLFVTSEATASMRKRAKEAGALGCVSKPLTAEALRNALAGTLGRGSAL